MDAGVRVVAAVDDATACDGCDSELLGKPSFEPLPSSMVAVGGRDGGAGLSPAAAAVIMAQKRTTTTITTE
jgi:hypothetical protein